jgi:signal transduction histidine kinase/ligand-binding sensor domain-containing protein
MAASSPRSYRLKLAILASLLFAHRATALDPNRAMSQYVHDQWRSDQGFPRGAVYAITQAADGYLWIGTEAGLVRFDGSNFRLIKDDSGAFTITGVLGLTPDNNGCLWLRLQDLTVLRYCDGVFNSPASDPLILTPISAMGRANNGGVLFARMETGVFSFLKGHYKMLAPAAGLPRSPVISLTQTPDGDIWMGTRDAGVFRFHAGKTTSFRDALPDPKVDCLLPSAGKELLAGTDNGLARWNGSDFSPWSLPAPLSHFQALAMTRDRDANIWVGTDSQGLLRLNSSGIAHLNERGTLSRAAITCIFEDREGSLWIGSAGRIERIRDSTFVTYSLPEGLPTDGANPVFVDTQNRMWFPPVTGGLWWVNNEIHGRIQLAGLEKDVVYSIGGRAAELWVGRQRGGLTQILSKGRSFSARTYTHANGLAQDSVYSVYQSRGGSVWSGTLSAGVSKLSHGTFTTYTVANGLISNTVASIMESANGTMWFATPGGISALFKDQWRSYTSSDGLPSDNVNCFLEDSRGVVWAGTAAGLAFHSGDKFKTPVGVPPALHEQILGLAEDRRGSFWIATSNHVLQATRERLLGGAQTEGDVREYGLSDGLRGVEGVKRHQSVFIDSTGRIWFSLNHGISVVDPVRLINNSAPAIAHIESVSADGMAMDLTTPLHMVAHGRRLVIGYVGLSLSVPERVRFRYRLDGFDHGWSEPTAEREAVYTNLSPAAYSFHVIASNPDGVWNPNEAAISFKVDPLFWQTWWFRVGVALTCSISILAVYRLRTLQLRRQLNVRFEERLVERTHIAQELHDTLLQGFLSASMHVHLASDQVAADSPAKLSLTRAIQLMAKVIEEGRNTLRGLSVSRSSSTDLEQALSRIEEELALPEQAGEKIDFSVIVKGQPKPLHPVLRDEVYRIGREALTNGFRHSHAKSVVIEMKYSARQLRMLVRDDGCGIDPRVMRSLRAGHGGLTGMRERAERIGAQLRIFRNAGKGTEVELKVPSKVAFQTSRKAG